jgi:hypothetical protein
MASMALFESDIRWDEFQCNGVSVENGVNDRFLQVADF